MKVINRANVRRLDAGPVKKIPIVCNILIGMPDKVTELPVLKRHDILPNGTGMLPQFPKSVKEFVSKQVMRSRFLSAKRIEKLQLYVNFK
jgi:hypothetical protein